MRLADALQIVLIENIAVQSEIPDVPQHAAVRRCVRYLLPVEKLLQSLGQLFTTLQRVALYRHGVNPPYPRAAARSAAAPDAVLRPAMPPAPRRRIAPTTRER